jgi:hypothetical protein
MKLPRLAAVAAITTDEIAERTIEDLYGTE